MILFLRIHLRLDFLCLISLVSSFAKEETRETRRKEKKEERLPRSRLPFDKIPLRQARWILSALMRDLRSFYVREFGRSKPFAPNSLVLWWLVIPYPSLQKTMLFRHCFLLDFNFLFQKRCCSDIVFVVVLSSDPNPFHQSSSKPMVFSHCFPEFSLGGPATFLKGAGASTTRKNERLRNTFPQGGVLTLTL